MRRKIEGTRRGGRLGWAVAISLPVLALMVSVVPALAASGGQANLSTARAATAAFHTLSAAQAAGYAA